MSRALLMVLGVAFAHVASMGQPSGYDSNKVESLRKQVEDTCKKSPRLNWYLDCTCLAEMVPGKVQQQWQREIRMAEERYASSGERMLRKACEMGEGVMFRNGMVIIPKHFKRPYSGPTKDPCTLLAGLEKGKEPDINVTHRGVPHISSMLMRLQDDAPCRDQEKMKHHLMLECDPGITDKTEAEKKASKSEFGYNCICYSTSLSEALMSAARIGPAKKMKLAAEVISGCQ